MEADDAVAEFLAVAGRLGRGEVNTVEMWHALHGHIDDLCGDGLLTGDSASVAKDS